MEQLTLFFFVNNCVVEKEATASRQDEGNILFQREDELRGETKAMYKRGIILKCESCKAL